MSHPKATSTEKRHHVFRKRKECASSLRNRKGSEMVPNLSHGEKVVPCCLKAYQYSLLDPRKLAEASRNLQDSPKGELSQEMPPAPRPLHSRAFQSAFETRQGLSSSSTFLRELRGLLTFTAAPSLEVPELGPFLGGR